MIFLIIFIIGNLLDKDQTKNIDILAKNFIKFNCLSILIGLFLYYFLELNIVSISLLHCSSFSVLFLVLSNDTYKNIKRISIVQFDTTEFFVFFISILIPFSNSFIVLESVCLRFLLITLLLKWLISSLPTLIKYPSMMVYGLLVLILIRMSYIFYTCREENMSCEQKIFSLSIEKSQVSPLKRILITMVSLAILFLANSFQKWQETQPKFLNIIKNLQVVFIVLYWLTKFLSSSDLVNPSMHLATAKFFFMITLIGIIRWFYEIFNNKTVSFDTYIRIINNIIFNLIVLLLGEYRSISICILFFLLNFNFKFSNIRLDIKPSLVSHLSLMILIQNYFFYATGHETTFTLIRWDAVFHGFDGDSNNLLIRILFITFLMISTYSSTVLVVKNVFLNMRNFGLQSLFKKEFKFRITTLISIVFLLLNSFKVIYFYYYLFRLKLILSFYFKRC